MEILEVFYNSSTIENQSANHPLIYALIASVFPKLTKWAKQRSEDKDWLQGFLEKWIIKDLTDVNATIEQNAQSLGEHPNILYKILPHLSVRIYHELSKEHDDVVDPVLVVKIIWIYRKLFLFLESYFKKIVNNNGVPSIIGTELKSHYKGIYFPMDMEMKQEISDNNY